MDKYQKYMDQAETSAEFKEKMKGLHARSKAPAWQRYGALAAALALVIGLGSWGLSRRDGQELGDPATENVPEIGEVVAPVPEPWPMPDIQTQTTNGYEVVHGESVSYYMLPYIKYGQITQETEADVALPVGVYRRDLTREELTALLDGEDTLTQHLNWGGYELYAFAMLNRDGSLWQLYIGGSKGDSGYEHFELQIRPGALPVSCLVYMDGGEVNEIWGTEVTAEAHDGENASSRRLSFFHGDYGYRFEIVGTDREAVEDIASRTARFFILNCCPYFAPEGDSEDVSTMPYDPSEGNTAAEQPAATAEPTPPPTEGNVRLSAEDVTPTGLTLVLERTAAGGQYMTGTPFTLERWETDRWVELTVIPYEGEGVLAWTDIGWLFPEEVGGRYEHAVSWSLRYGELTSGRYRMVKDVSGMEMYAEFEITE